ncbi:hypothetical protein [Capillimicrobium parvum]|uniref:hypothetical protein n=1 Tax=Capillimicrobium parvum TaxID=2884022 RepID=UPI00216B3796|nr:hypothetical protein [Capillimicrobium parvum]
MQIAAALGLPLEPRAQGQRLAWDIYTILDAWCDSIALLDWEVLIKPTPSRGRSLRNLTVNVSYPIGLLPAAWRTGRFDWQPERDDEVELELRSSRGVHDFGRSIADRYLGFLADEEAQLPLHDREVHSSRGDMSFRSLVEYQRWHAGFHYRQLRAFCRGQRIDLPPDVLASVPDLVLPDSVF